MAQLSTGQEFGAKYVLTGPDGTIAAFNDQADPNYVGMLTEITGLDSPDLRESADDLVQMDGGIHGDFFHGRRPVTMTGLILNPPSAAERNVRMTKLAQAANALRGDATLAWTPSGSVSQYLSLRKQQPTRFTGGWQKQFQLALVAADPRIYSSTLNTQTVTASTGGAAGGIGFDLGFDWNFGPATVTGQMFVENQGNAETFPVYTITGPGTNPVVYNARTGKNIVLFTTLNAGETLVIDSLNRTVLFNGITSKYSAVDVLSTQWGGLVRGVNDIRIGFFSYTAPASLRVAWRHAWL